ncbi:MAG: GNAT family N-acetyltransferase [Planctomycetes bacterium]|nr:GNAT family N-acetyltransferase [Planctomycetota bacterium]
MTNGTKIRLAPFEERDKTILFAWANNPELAHYNSPYRPVHWEAHCDWFRSIASDRTKVVFGLRTIPGDTLVGYVQLKDIHPVHRSAELAIQIGEAADRGRGYGKAAVSLLLAYAWSDLNLHRVSLRVLADNAAAINIYEACGLVIEGRLRSSAYVEGAWRDELLMAIVNGERFTAELP